MKEDWRLNGQERYLFGENLFCITSAVFRISGFDHMHCDFCWAKISPFSEDLHEGYATFDIRHFICEECFNDFREQFQWTLDERIENFNDFQEKYQKLYGKTIVVRKIKSLSDEKECGICKKKITSSTDELCACTEDEEIWFCSSCADDFSDIFHWEQVD